PTGPDAPAAGASQAGQIIEQISSSIRAPYIVQTALGAERQLPWNTTLAVTYASSHGLRMLRSRNINAPLPGSYDPAISGSGFFPYGPAGPTFLMESAGLYNQNQLI